MFDRHRTILRRGLFVLLLASPVPLGSVEPWSVLAIELCAAALGALALWILWRDPDSLPTLARKLLLLYGVIVAVGLLQLVPVPHGLAAVLSPAAAEAHAVTGGVLGAASGGFVPLSLEPPATVDALLRFVAYGLLGLAAAVGIREPAHCVSTAAVLALAGGLQGLYGAAEYFSGHQHILWYPKRYHTDEASGTFINRNHFAGYLAMTLPFAFALVLEGARRLPAAAGRHRWLALAAPGGLTLLGGALAGALAWLGVLLSYSRGGLAAALVATACFVSAAGVRSRVLRALVLVLALPVLLLLVREVRAPGERFFAETEELVSLSGRLPAWRAASAMALESPLLGTGLGSFEGAFALYRPAEIRRHWRHAHNDWLQAWVEGGVPVLAALLAAAWLLGRALARRAAATAPVAAALAALALHGFVDFGVRIPAIGVLAAFLVGLACVAPGLAGTAPSPGRFPARA